MNIDPSLVGIIGSLILIIGAALPDPVVQHPIASRKNQFFTIGNACMFTYAVLNYFAGGELLFILLQILIAVSTILMLLDTDDDKDTPVLACIGAGLIVYALYISHGFETILFIVGLVGLGIGFALDTGSAKRNLALSIGSAVVAWFSYLVGDPIFLWLNVFFAVFSFYHYWRLKAY